MKKSIGVFYLLFGITVFGQNSIVDHLSVPGPITFNSLDFNLVWTSNPEENFYIQEYLPKGQIQDSFTNLLILNVVITELELKDVVKNKIMELKVRNQTDPVCNYELIENPDGDEFILDFLMSESDEDSLLTLLEFNIYHLSQISINETKNAIILFAYSERSYMDDIRPFMNKFHSIRERLINEMILIDKPKVSVTQD